jgi:hypothetical protein
MNLWPQPQATGKGICKAHWLKVGLSFQSRAGAGNYSLCHCDYTIQPNGGNYFGLSEGSVRRVVSLEQFGGPHFPRAGDSPSKEEAGQEQPAIQAIQTVSEKFSKDAHAGVAHAPCNRTQDFDDARGNGGRVTASG